MTRFLMPIILIGIAITVFFVFTNPLYNEISVMKTQMSSYNEALDNSKSLETERDRLVGKYNAMDPANITKLEKLLPSNIDNIRLILEIGQIAAPYGMVLQNVKYSASTDTATTGAQGGATNNSAPKDYGIFNLEFSVSGNYNNFINFTKDLESNLRIVDISSVSFSSGGNNATGKTGSAESYTYDFGIKTYWLKN